VVGQRTGLEEGEIDKLFNIIYIMRILSYYEMYTE